MSVSGNIPGIGCDPYAGRILSCAVESRRVESCPVPSRLVESSPVQSGHGVSPPHHASSGEGSFASSYPHLRQTSVPSARTYTDPLSHRGHTGRGIFVVVAFLCIHTHTHTKNISLPICVLTSGFQKREVILILERHIEECYVPINTQELWSTFIQGLLRLRSSSQRGLPSLRPGLPE